MKKIILILAVIFFCGKALAQADLQPIWSVPSYIDTCQGANAYRWVYPGAIQFDTAGNLVWIMQDRSTCNSPYNNFTLLKVTPKGLPLLSTFRKYEVPPELYNYNNLIAIHGNRGYWLSPSYAVDTMRSLFLVALDLTTGDTLWMRRWKPLGPTTYAPVSLVATDSAVYFTSSAYTYFGEPTPIYYYAMMITKFDSHGNEAWTNIYEQPYMNYSSWVYRGNIIVTDSLVYSAGFRYSDVTPLWKGHGFIGSFDNATGAQVDSFYFPIKRRDSEFDPNTLVSDGKKIYALGTNPTQADAATFIASFSMHLDSLSFSDNLTGPYSYLGTAAMSDNGFAYATTYSYSTPGYYYAVSMYDCRSTPRLLHRALTLDPTPLEIAGIASTGGSLYVSGSAYDPDTNITLINRRNAYITKYDVAPLAVHTPSAIAAGTMNVYPNPVSTQAMFASSSDLHDGDLEIIDGLGRTLRSYPNLQGNEFLFSRGELASGVYFYRLRESGMVVASGKIIIE
jgi:hypothetical protein